MDWRMDTYGLRTWVSPFRYLRINAYLQLPEAFRSLSRLSSALSAKASTLRSLLLNHTLLSKVRLHSVAISCWNDFSFFVHKELSLLFEYFYSPTFVGLGCLVSFVSYLSIWTFEQFLISVFGFQGTILNDFSFSGLKWTRTIDLTLIRRAL